MGFFSKVVDHVSPPTSDLGRARGAYAALRTNAAAEEAAGVQEETSEFERLNGAVNDAVGDRGRWFGARAFHG